jgi:ribosomal-protein-alanine N-acetyltransferase
MELRTPRLILRRARQDDLADLHALLSDAEATHFWSTPPYRRIRQTQRWLADMMASRPEVSEDFVIEHEGRVIGKIGAFRLPEFGYVLRPDHWGRGLAGEAMTAFLGHVWRRGDVSRLIADIDPRNAASIRLVERHGFRFSHRAQRTIRTHLGWCDSAYYVINRAGMARAGSFPSPGGDRGRAHRGDATGDSF